MSEKLFVKCRRCDANVMKSDSACRHCGASQRSIPKFIGKLAIAILAVVFIAEFVGTYNSYEVEAAKAKQVEEILKPDSQHAFIDIVQRFQLSYKDSSNPILSAELRNSRANALMSSKVSQEVSGWTGKVTSVDVTGSNNAILSIEIEDDISVTTWNNELSDLEANTLIPRGSKLYLALMDIKRGDRVQFDGSFLPSEKDYFAESSLTEEGSMNDPEYLFRFTSVKTL